MKRKTFQSLLINKYYLAWMMICSICWSNYMEKYRFGKTTKEKKL